MEEILAQSTIVRTSRDRLDALLARRDKTLIKGRKLKVTEEMKQAVGTQADPQPGPSRQPNTLNVNEVIQQPQPEPSFMPVWVSNWFEGFNFF